MEGTSILHAHHMTSPKDFSFTYVQLMWHTYSTCTCTRALRKKNCSCHLHVHVSCQQEMTSITYTCTCTYCPCDLIYCIYTNSHGGFLFSFRVSYTLCITCRCFFFLLCTHVHVCPASGPSPQTTSSVPRTSSTPTSTTSASDAAGKCPSY